MTNDEQELLNELLHQDLGKKETSELGRAIFDLFMWQYNPRENYFTIKLYILISSADKYNRLKIKQVFPVEMRAFEMWEAAPDPAKFFEKWGCAL